MYRTKKEKVAYSGEFVLKDKLRLLRLLLKHRFFIGWRAKWHEKVHIHAKQLKPWMSHDNNNNNNDDNDKLNINSDSSNLKAPKTR